MFDKAQCLGWKGSEITGRRIQPQRMLYIFFPFYNISNCKNLLNPINIGYCGYTTNFPSVSQSCIWQSPTAPSLALLTSPAQFCLASRFLFARLLLTSFLLEKPIKFLTDSFFLHHIKSNVGPSTNAWKQVYWTLQFYERKIEKKMLHLHFLRVSETKKSNVSAE